VVQNVRKASIGAPSLVRVAEPKPGPKKSRRRKPYSPARRVGRPSGYRIIQGALYLSLPFECWVDVLLVQSSLSQSVCSPSS
jgi:hypothetical protein